MSEVGDDPIDVVGREGRLRGIQLAAHLDLRDDRAEGAEPRHVAGLALAGGEVGALGQVVEDRLRLLPFGDADQSLPHAVVLD